MPGKICKLKNHKEYISQFDLPPDAKAGVLSMKLENNKAKPHHDHFKPHRDNHYLLMLATHGRFKINIDFKELPFDAPAMLLIPPGQVHYIIDTHEPKGWAISFDPILIAKEFGPILEKSSDGFIALDPQTAFYQRTVTLIDLIEKRQSDVPAIYTGRSTHALLDALVALIAEELIARSTGNKTKENRAVAIEQAFQQLLKKNFEEWKQPSQYAAELNISVSYLYDVVKAITGEAVSAHIQHYAILEAKRLLYFTDLSIKEIGYKLGYHEPAYFGKLFKKISGLTPLQFRQQYHD